MWGLATHPTQPIFATCSQENLVCVWNGEKQELIWSYFIEVGFISNFLELFRLMPLNSFFLKRKRWNGNGITGKCKI